MTATAQKKQKNTERTVIVAYSERPSQLRAATEEARRRGISRSEYIRLAVARDLARDGADA